MKNPHVNTLRQQLLSTLSDLRNRESPMDPDRARAIAQVAGVLVDSAKVEVDYLRVTGQSQADFLEQPRQIDSDTAMSGLPNGITTITRHRLKG